MPHDDPALVVPVSDYLWYVDQALDQMTAIIRELGDGAASTRPDPPGANSAYAILTHCLGVMEHWGGAMVAGRTIERDRDAEFVATGRVDDLLDRTARARRQLESDLATLDSLAAPRTEPDPDDADLPLGQRQGAIALHIYEELSQHLGQMELTRDVVLASRRDD